MKTKLLSILSAAMILLMAWSTHAQYPFTEDFESGVFPPSGWSIYNQAGDATWAQNENANHTPEGQFSAFHTYASGNQDGWLVTPQIAMPTEGFFFLTFWNINGDASWYGNNSVLVSTGSGNPDDNEFVEVWSPAIAAAEWDPVFIDLQAYAGEDIFIAFRYQGDFAHIWVIDDIALGEELNTDPVIVVTPDAVDQSVAQTGTSTNRLIIANDGIGGLTFDVDFEYTDQEGWLSIDPVSGSVQGNTSQEIQLTFSGNGLDFGAYTGVITVTSNDTENPEITIPVTMNVMDVSPVGVTILVNEYTFPTAISENGQYVVGTPFGGGSGYYWSQETGTINLAAGPDGVSNDGTVVVSYEDPELTYNGNPVQVTGRWSFEAPEFEFLGMNPEAPEFFMTDYNSGWGISANGVIVGMQYYPPYQYMAFSWTEEDGYDNIGGNPILQGNRPNGITGDGSIVYGWTQTDDASRSPIIWYNDTLKIFDPTANGEASGASHNGQYVAGNIGQDAFLWIGETDQTIIFENTINDGLISPTTVSNDGYVFGFTAEGWPPFPDTRRAFVRTPAGILITFNEYAVNRGWFDAAEWLFYSINGVSASGNRFIGAGIDRDGNYVSFLIDFDPDLPVIEINPDAFTETLEAGETSTQTLEISNSGTGNLNYQAVVQFMSDAKEPLAAPAGRSAKRSGMELGVKKDTDGFNPATRMDKNAREGVVLNYDGANVDAIGLIAGGTFYGAARYPADMVTPFSGYVIESIDVYVGDVPTEMEMFIWQAGTTTAPGSVLHQQVVVPEESSWNTFYLDETITVSNEDVWVGFRMTHDAGSFILGIDGGPYNLNGNWLSQDAVAWENSSDYGLNGNWNIRTRLQYDGIQWLSLDPSSGVIAEGETNSVSVNFNAEGLFSGTYQANIRVSGNDMDNALILIPVTLEVTGADGYYLTVHVNPENAGIATGAGQYAEGHQVTVTAMPSDGFEFVNWTHEDAEISSDPSFTYTMPAEDVALTAHFAEIAEVYTLTLLVNPEDAGVVTGAGDYEEGTVVTFNAAANDGFVFVNWTDEEGNAISDVEQNDITLTSDLTLVAHFVEDEVSVHDVWENRLSIFPNPANDLLQLIGDIHLQQVSIMDMTGKVVYHARVTGENVTLNVASLSQGFYLLRVISKEGEVHHTRIIISR